MSLYNISLVVFFVAVGLLFLFDLGQITQVVAGVAALVCAALLVFGEGRGSSLRT